MQFPGNSAQAFLKSAGDGAADSLAETRAAAQRVERLTFAIGTASGDQRAVIDAIAAGGAGAARRAHGLVEALGAILAGVAGAARTTKELRAGAAASMERMRALQETIERYVLASTAQ